MAKSAYLAGEMLDHLYGGGDYARPATVYLALFAALTPTELSGAGYARVAVTNNATNWPAATGGVKANGAALIFPTATGDWAEAVAWGLYDASSGGNLLYWGLLDPAVTVLSGETARLPAGDLVITEADGAA